MRRPLPAVCLFLAAGIAISFYTDIRCRHLCILCMGACFVAEAVFRTGGAGFLACSRSRGLAELSFERGRRTRALAAACLLAFLWGSFRMDMEEARASGLSVEPGGTVEALVTGAVWKGSYWQLTAREGGLRGEKFLVRLSAAEEDMEAVCSLVGRQCNFAGTVREPDGRRNFGCFDYRLYLRGRGIFRILEVNRYRARGGLLKQPLLNSLAVSKARFYGRVRPFLDEEDFSLLAAQGVRVFRTDVMGAVGFTRLEDGFLRAESADGRVSETLGSE